MIRTLIVFLSIFLSSCCLYLKNTNIEGTYIVVDKRFGPPVKYILEIKNDSTFCFQIIGPDARPRCEGKWNCKGNRLLLRCNEIESFEEMLTNGYMSEREHLFRIVDNKSLMYEDLLLEKSSK